MSNALEQEVYLAQCPRCKWFISHPAEKGDGLCDHCVLAVEQDQRIAALAASHAELLDILRLHEWCGEGGYRMGYPIGSCPECTSYADRPHRGDCAFVAAIARAEALGAAGEGE